MNQAESPLFAVVKPHLNMLEQGGLAKLAAPKDQ